MRHTSASQIAKMRGCPRQWGANKLAGIEEPTRVDPDTGADPRDAGKALHKIGEQYLDQGIAPDPADEMGLRFIPGLRFLPPPGSGGVEQEIDAVLGGVKYKEFIDAITRTALLPPPQAEKKEPLEDYLSRQQLYTRAVAEDWPAVLDHKSTKNPKRKFRDGSKVGLATRDQFLDDSQAMLYAATALVLNPGAKGVYLRWVYYATHGAPYAECRDCALTRAEILAAFNLVVQRWAVPLVLIRAKPKGEVNWLDLPANPAQCEKYKSPKNPPCHLTPRCFDVTATDRALAALNTPEEARQAMEDLLEELRRQAKADPRPADPINGVVRKGKAEPAPVEQEDDGEDLLAALSGGKAKAEPMPVPAKASIKGKAKAVPVEPDPIEVSTEPTHEEAKAIARAAPVERDPVALSYGDQSTTTLRDMFAASALETARLMVSARAFPAVDTVAVCAYALADALLKARSGA